MAKAVFKKIAGETAAGLSGIFGLVAGYGLGQAFGQAAAWTLGNVTNVANVALTANFEHLHTTHHLMMNVFGSGFGAFNGIVGALGAYFMVYNHLPQPYKCQPTAPQNKPKM